MLKDFKWLSGKDKGKYINTPIGQGMIDFSRYFRMLKDTGLDYPVSLHLEYDLGGAEKGKTEPTMPQSEVLNAIKQDVETIKRVWSEA